MLNIVVDGGREETSLPSQKVDDAIDEMDDAVSLNYDKIFADPSAGTTPAFDALRNGRHKQLKVLFMLHSEPFAVKK